MVKTLANVAGFVALVGGIWFLLRCLDRLWAPKGRGRLARRWRSGRGSSRRDRSRRGWSRRGRHPPEPLPAVLLGLELRRMANEIRRVEAGNEPSKAARLAACTLAYDHVLRDYCRSLDLPVPAGGGALSPEQRFEMESELIGAGHDW